MKKIGLIALACAFILCACGNNEPDDPAQVPRTQDGNGKVFLEKGKLVDATLNYSQAQLIDALNHYEWVQEYAFYYDNKTASGKTKIPGLPIKMHTNATIEYDSEIPIVKTWLMSIDGKVITATMRFDPISSTYYPPEKYTVIALDLSPNTGRIVMDRKLPYEVKGYDAASLHARMVWKAVIP